MTSAIFRLGLVGFPLEHSLSPRIHTAALKACGLAGNYSLFPIRPQDKQPLKDLLGHVRTGEIQGLNVTIPHKQSVIELLDRLTPTAKAIGAVNTIYMRHNKIIGDNTDAPGFLLDLEKFLNTETQRHRDACALVLGAGGSARAIIYALLDAGWDVTLSARRTEQANELANQFENIKVIEYNVLTLNLMNVQLVVNATPVGMTPNTDQSPWPQSLPFPPRSVIYDLVYNPSQTKLVKDACLQGLRATTGLGMLIEQAILSFEIWTGYKPSREVMLDAANQTAH